MKGCAIMKRLIPAILAFLVLTIGCTTQRYNSSRVREMPVRDAAPQASYEYKHKTIEKARPKPPEGEKKRIAIRRLADTKPVEGSPFGTVATNEIAIIDPKDNTISKITLTQLINRIEPRTPRFTEKMVHELIKSGMFEVIERADIDDIMRELSFENESGKVNPETKARMNKLEGIELIVSGNYGVNDRLLQWYLDMDKRIKKARLDSPGMRLSRPEARDILEDMINTKPPEYILILRAYEVETGIVRASTQVEGDTETRMIKEAVDELIEQIY